MPFGSMLSPQYPEKPRALELDLAARNLVFRMTRGGEPLFVVLAQARFQALAEALGVTGSVVRTSEEEKATSA